ncbi:MAG: polysaccharide biosynthesis/export family protein [Rhizobiaceae bacterium]
MQTSDSERRWRRPFLRLFFAVAAPILLLMAHVAVAGAAEYQLGVLDKLQIRVAEWQTAQAAVRDWASINGEYTVSPAGTISLPFVGEMAVKGKTTSDVADSIGKALQQKFGLLDRPDASVEVAEFRPFFVSGDVQTPGKYPYLPGLTVLKAVSLAGGMRHSLDSGQRFERDFIDARGNYQVLASQRLGLLAARARLIAEASGQDKIDFPKELQDSAQGRKLIENETAFMEARQKKLDTELKALADLKKLLQNEVSSLEQKMETQQRQVELSKKDLESVGNLAQHGLAVNQRVLALEEKTAELEGKILDLETASLQAKQAISKADQDATTLRNDRISEIAQTRQQTEADLQAVELKMQMYRDLMTEAARNDPTLAASAAQPAAAPTIIYSIVRETDGKTEELHADENTPVLPGDVVKAEMTLPATVNSN